MWNHTTFQPDGREPSSYGHPAGISANEFLARENFSDSDDRRAPPSTVYIARWKSAPVLDW